MSRTRRIALLLVLGVGVFLAWPPGSTTDWVAPAFEAPVETRPGPPAEPGPASGPEVLQQTETAARLPASPSPEQDEPGPMAVLRIRVVDEVGSPLARARVQVQPAEFPMLFRLAENDPWKDPKARPRGLTNDRGLLVLEDLPVRSVKVFVDLQSFSGATSEETRLREGTNDLEVVLQSPGALEVALVSGDGTPVPEVAVWATGWLSARSDAAGVARFAELAPGRYRPEVHDLVQFSREQVEVRARESARISLVVLEGGWIEGELRDARGDGPEEVWVVDAIAGFEDEAEDLTPHPVQPGERYRLGPLLPGRYRVAAQRGDMQFWASAPIHGSPEVEVRAGEVTECSVLIATRSPTILSGTVRAPVIDGAAPEIVVLAQTADALPIGDLVEARTTVSAGAFELELPRPGTWMVTPVFARPGGLPCQGEALLCEVGESGGHVELGFGSYRVSGRVEPAGPFGIWALDGVTGRAGVIPAAIATESGSWDVVLEHPGPWYFVATGSGVWSGRSAGPSAMHASTPVRVELSEDAPTRDGVVLRASGKVGPFAALDVGVFDRDGAPVEEGFDLHVRDGELDLPLRLARALEPGERTWWLRAVRRDDCSAEVALDPESSSRVRLDLRPGAFLRVETTLAGRPAAARVRLLDGQARTIQASYPRGLFASLSAHVDAPHRRTLGPLPPGDYQVEAAHRGGARRRVHLELEAGTKALAVGFD